MEEHIRPGTQFICEASDLEEYLSSRDALESPLALLLKNQDHPICVAPKGPDQLDGEQ